jgi:hypothetical protein
MTIMKRIILLLQMMALFLRGHGSWIMWMLTDSVIESAYQKDRFIEFIVKETVDNALDFIENEAPRLIKKYGSFTPELKVIVTKESNYLRIRILNSDCETSGFTDQFIRSIFNFHESTGSKRNQYKVTKGWLGDALKAICGIHYALTHEVGNDNWNEPLIITSRNKQFRVKPVIDRAKKGMELGQNT